MRAVILIAMHKPYWVPDDDIYLPVQMGRALHPSIGGIGDDTGDNISAKNASFCELTGLYWAWKNLPADYLGLVHYRRYFASRRPALGRFRRVLRGPELRALLCKTDVILPKERHYFIESNYTQYIHSHHARDLATVRAIIARRCPEYLPAYDLYMSKTHGHHFNMFIMKRELLDRYCQWLFDILFTLEQELDTSGYSDYDRRVFGFVGERLLDAWLTTNGIAYQELGVLYLESQHWLHKGGSFLKRKFFPRHREETDG